jgi:hypothetical protein
MGWAIPESKAGGKTEKPPVGNHLAVLVAVIDMGKQLDDFDKSKPYWAWRAYFVWELVGEQIAGTEKNHVIAIDLALSTGEKSKLRKWVQARTGKPFPSGPFDPTTELGQACFLNVIEKGGYPKVDGVAAVPKGIPVPKPAYPLTALSLEEFKGGTMPPEWTPWLYGSPIEDHIRACQELGGPKPQPKKKADAAPVGAGGDSTSLGGPVPF